MFPGNGRLGLPAVMGVYVLQSGETGAPLAVLDGTRLTHRRTAAVSALGADLLARPEASRLLVVGAGALAPFLARAPPPGRRAAPVPRRGVEPPPGRGRAPRRIPPCGGDAGRGRDGPRSRRAC